VLRSLCRAGNSTPVIFLTMLQDDIYEDAALEGGAVDFIDKSRRLSVLVKRLRLTVGRARPAPEAEDRQTGLYPEFWPSWAALRTLAGKIGRDVIDLTLIELKIVALLALRAGEPVRRSERYQRQPDRFPSPWAGAA
jgi:two-component system, OmpR family, response regulator ChvI